MWDYGARRGDGRGSRPGMVRIKDVGLLGKVVVIVVVWRRGGSDSSDSSGDWHNDGHLRRWRAIYIFSSASNRHDG
jgi:hypothetical protein